jgi:hypothetical protein
MSATPRSARLSKPGEVVAILVASAVVWAVLITVVATLFFAVFIPAVQFGGRGEIPDDFPVYPGAHLDSALASRSPGCTTVDATWSTKDGASQVVDFYRERLSIGEWLITDTTPPSDSTVLYFRSTSIPNREGYLSVSRQPYSSQTQITMTMAKSAGGTPSSVAVSRCHVLVGALG